MIKLFCTFISFQNLILLDKFNIKFLLILSSEIDKLFMSVIAIFLSKDISNLKLSNGKSLFLSILIIKKFSSILEWKYSLNTLLFDQIRRFFMK